MTIPKPSQIASAKSSLRREMLARREALGAADRTAAAQAFTRNFLARVALSPEDAVALYHPIRGEMDVRPLLAALHARGQVCALPCIQHPSPLREEDDFVSERSELTKSGGGDSLIYHPHSSLQDTLPPPGRGVLAFRLYAPGDGLAESAFGISEPLPSAPEVVPTVLVVPLLAFDNSGHRLGYGGGFYDCTIRTLRAANPALRCIGAGYGWQKINALPLQGHDERLDEVVTDDR